MTTLTELLKDYRNSIERALAGHMTNKTDADLSDEEVEKAVAATQKVTDLKDYIDLTGALDNNESEVPNEDEDPDATLHRIMKKYNIQHMSESDYVDRDVMMKEGFKYFGVFEDEKMRTSVTKYLDENEIDYMDDGTGHIQMRFGDRDSAYRVEEHIARMVRKSNPHFMRDHVENVNEDEDDYDEYEQAGVRDGGKVIDPFDDDGEHCDLCGPTGYSEDDMTDCPSCREYYCPEHDDYDGCPHCGSMSVNERAPDTNKDGSPIDPVDEVPDNVISFAEFRKQHPEIKKSR